MLDLIGTHRAIIDSDAERERERERERHFKQGLVGEPTKRLVKLST
jgi:hypothetical protein